MNNKGPGAANDMANEFQENGQQAGCDERLFSEFSHLTYEEWKQAAEKTLKGASFEKKLITKTYEGINLQPMYFEKDIKDLSHINSLPGFVPYVRGTGVLGYLGKPWEVSQELAESAPEEFNRAALYDLERGQTELNILLDNVSRFGMDVDEARKEDIGRGGLSISTVADLGCALSDIDIEQIPLFIQAPSMALPVSALLVAFMRSQGKDVKKLRGCIGFDPLSDLVTIGNLPVSLEVLYDQMAQLIAWGKVNAPNLQTVIVQGHPYHNGGSNAVQELAFTIATAVEYLGAMQARGLEVNDVASHMRFSFSIGSKYFMEVVKLRAARVIWTQVVEAFGGNETAQKMNIHVRTSAWNKTIYDPYVNMLRVTLEAFAGIVGGINSMHVGPFDESMRTADEFSRRIARNTQTILNKECNLNRLIDPAGGSWYIEKLTDELASKAWNLFQQIEAHGGMFKSLQEGFPQSLVAGVAAARRKSIATRKDVFVGTNMYPNLLEKPLETRSINQEAFQRRRLQELTEYRARVDRPRHREALESLAQERDARPVEFGSGHIVTAAIEAALAGASLGEIVRVLHETSQGAPVVGAIKAYRGAEIFESLRTASEKYKAKTGSRPKVFLANMGPIPQHKARADFSTGFFEVGGFETIRNDGFSSVEAAARAAIDSGVPVVVICSTDDTYPEIVPSLTQTIKKAKPDTTVILAGYPVDYLDIFRQAGVDEFIHVRANCYEILLKLQKQKGIV